MLGSEAYEKICSALNNTYLRKGTANASPIAQTSCLEGYHSVINQFAPKMLAYSYLGMLCRLQYIFQIIIDINKLKIINEFSECEILGLTNSYLKIIAE